MEDLYQEFARCGAILNGHFKLSSGLHSAIYVQCAIYLQSPKKAATAAKMLIERLPDNTKENIELVVAPAMGGLIIGYEVAKLLDKDFIFFERVNGTFTLKRGFTIPTATNVLLVEDVITTGGSSLEIAERIQDNGANIIAECAIVNRSDKDFAKEFNFPVYDLLKIKAENFTQDNLPDSLKKITPLKPGSRQ